MYTSLYLDMDTGRTRWVEEAIEATQTLTRQPSRSLTRPTRRVTGRPVGFGESSHFKKIKNKLNVKNIVQFNKVRLILLMRTDNVLIKHT